MKCLPLPNSKFKVHLYYVSFRNPLNTYFYRPVNPLINKNENIYYKMILMARAYDISCKI